MVNYTREQLMESYKKLPQDVQEAIIGVETADIIRQIGEEKKMMVDKIGELAEETGLVLLGFTHPSQFVSHLAERLGIEKSVAKEIAEQVNTRIFFPVRENLKKIHGLREEEAEAPIAPTPSPLPSALMPEPVILETIMPVQPVPVEPETATPPPPTTKTDFVAFVAPETSVQQVTSIFEAKTKEGVFRLPAEVTEKKTEPSFIKAPESKKIDPYREPII